ncbi:MAG TPA: radical SAM family heme chaperone HemW, partial [Steroidobacteraceae bacterium]|nr:radical SAM family heme chaperone HemW [Steroidobacteraceae bacterium]
DIDLHVKSRLLIPPLAVYVHLPWCVRKCPYCDFNSHAIEGSVPEKRYADALLADLQTQAARIAGRTVRSIFFGGGTPSLFSAETIGRVLAGIRGALEVAADAEITLEANPGTVERGRFAEYAAAGVNRISLGGQSFNPRHLARLGRIHSAEETRTAAAELHAAGIDNFNIDLMYGLPEQTLAESLADIEAAIELAPAHLSHYQLTLEPGTVFFHRPPPLPDDDASWDMQLGCQETLAAHGFDQYEVSAYARDGRRCAHNLNYWQFGDYLGIGAGAHGKITELPDRVSRTARTRQPRQYLEAMERAAAPPDARPVAPGDMPFEFMMNALRLLDGFAEEAFEDRTGIDFETVKPTVLAAAERGTLEPTRSPGWRPTPLGLRFLNDVIVSFLPPAAVLAQAANPL